MTELQALLNIASDRQCELLGAEHDVYQARYRRTYALHRAVSVGATHDQLAAALGVSRQRVGQLLRETTS